MKTEMTSKERILATIDRKPVDHIPLCFEGVCHGGVRFMDELFPDPFERASRYLERGVDTGVNLVFPDVTSRENLSVKEWQAVNPDNGRLLMIKEYNTPKGSLRQAVYKDSEYPFDTIHLFNDYHVPSGRSFKYLIDREEELDRLEYILSTPGRHEMAKSLEFAEAARKFRSRNQVMLTGVLFGVGDPLMWLSGVENVLYAAMDAPDFLDRYIDIVSRWNMNHMKILIDSGVDMIVRRGWYECTDFWSPALYERYLFEPLRKEIEAAHQAGVKYTYIMNSGVMPLLDQFSRLGFDILTNTEPDKNDLAGIKKAIGHRITLCSGVNNYHVIEAGAEEEVDKAVRAAVGTLSENGGFILAPSDSILDTSENAKRNFNKMIETWKEIC